MAAEFEFRSELLHRALLWLSMPSVNRGVAETLREALRPGVWGYVEDIRLRVGRWDSVIEVIDEEARKTTDQLQRCVSGFNRLAGSREVVVGRRVRPNNSG